MAVATPRLPGIGFETVTPPPAEVLPRMDIAVFVGFAASGPLHRPVSVADVAQFTAIFGEDAPLAWDAQRGERVYAHLGPAVRAFFQNGGRRCWVVRVAGNALVNHFLLPGLLQVQPDAVGQLVATPAFAPARSEGSWSDPLRVGAAVSSQLVEVLHFAPTDLTLDLNVRSPAEVVPGDLLRLTFERGKVVLFLPVGKITHNLERSPPSSSNTRGTPVRIQGSAGFWFQASWASAPITGNGRAVMFSSQGGSVSVPATVPVKTATLASPPGTLFDWPSSADDPTVRLNLRLTAAEAPPPGTLLRVDLDSREFWLLVEDYRAVEGHGSPPGEAVQVVGQGLWRLPSVPSLLALPDSCERLHLEIEVQRPAARTEYLRELGFVAAHPRFWDALPSDAQLYGSEPGSDPDRAGLWQSAAQPRFALAGYDRKEAFFLPLAMPLLPQHFLSPERQTADALTRDGLAQFHARLFLDPRGDGAAPPPLRPLLEASTHTLLDQADFLRYQLADPPRFTGIYAALGIEEATLIAVPDAVHHGWKQSGEMTAPSPLPSSPLEHPEWWHFLGCNPPAKIELEREPRRDNFLDCGLLLITPPVLSLEEPPDRAGTFTLAWTPRPVRPRVRYILEESARPDFSVTAEVYAGPDTRRRFYGRTPGVYYFRVRAEVDGVTSDWSNGVAVSVAPPGRWTVLPTGDDPNPDLLAVQRALLRLCAARGDLLAVLALPEHYREELALRHAAALASPAGPPHAGVGPLSLGEAATLSYGALYHPWLTARDENRASNFRNNPPDGAACGLLARRALSRGAWIAPANEVLRGNVALTPVIARGRWLDLQEGRINLVRQEPRGFVCLNADTLSRDDDLRPINVRRLLILLRRLALRHGSTYVFEPHDASFRRSVQRDFEGFLDLLFTRGAFAGATPAASYQVRTDSALNTPRSVEQGRFVVELRVAPSRPLRFLTVRLTQTGGRSVVTEER